MPAEPQELHIFERGLVLLGVIEQVAEAAREGGIGEQASTAR